MTGGKRSHPAGSLAPIDPFLSACYRPKSPRASACKGVRKIVHHFTGDIQVAIATAIQRGPCVYIYDENGRQLGVISTGPAPNGLAGFTNSTVSIRRGGYIYIYDERGRQRSVLSARS